MNFQNLLVEFFSCFQAATGFLEPAALHVIIWLLCWGQDFHKKEIKMYKLSYMLIHSVIIWAVSERRMSIY